MLHLLGSKDSMCGLGSWLPPKQVEHSGREVARASLTCPTEPAEAFRSDYRGVACRRPRICLSGRTRCGLFEGEALPRLIAGKSIGPR